MKDAFWNIRTLKWIAIICILAMVFVVGYESWSQTHLMDEEPLLYAVLGSIFGIFLIVSFTHHLKDEKNMLINILGIRWLRNRHLFRVIAYSFFGVLVFGVNSKVWWVELLHLVFTGLGILFAYLTLLFFYESKLGRGLAILGTCIGIPGFLGAWFFDYTIGVGEMIAATPIIVWIWNINKKI